MRHLSNFLLLAAFTCACSRSSPPASTAVAGTNTTITGTVVERLDGPPYRYLRLKTENGEKVWVAVPMATVESGGKVTVKNGAVLKNFESKQAGRKFEAVVFGVMERG